MNIGSITLSPSVGPSSEPSPATSTLEIAEQTPERPEPCSPATKLQGIEAETEGLRSFRLPRGA